ncbi:MAG: sulfotransferase [Planctomycetales bacterium]|nr:sulfotransferase [Planctomycetales bacterium]
MTNPDPRPTCKLSLTDARRPSFFLVGAPRCGTTALFRWLGQHPGLFLSSQKECHYFAHDIPGFRAIHKETDYLNLFRDAKADQFVGEASVMYLCSACAIDEILKFSPQARLLVTLRNPIEIVQSWHEQLLVTGQEDVTDLWAAWRLRHQRREGKSLPRHCMDPMIPQYEHIARLGEQVESLLSKVDRSRVMFLQYDELRADPGGAYRRVLEWLGVPDDGFDRFEVVNRNRQPVSPFAQRVWSRNPTIRKLRGLTRRALGEARYAAVRDAVIPRLSHTKPRTGLDPALRSEMEACFKHDVEQLSDLLSSDFRPWLKQAA